MMKKTVIFDLDGTLLYTLDSITQTLGAVLKNHNLPLLPPQTVKTIVGNGVIDLLHDAFKICGSKEIPDEATVSEFKALFLEHANDNVYPYEGIRECLQLLKENGVCIACNTNKPDKNAHIILDYHFKDCFDLILGNVEHLPKKPNPAGVFYILEQLHGTAEACIYIGDSEVDVQTAKNAGCAFIGAAWGYRDAKLLQKAGALTIAQSADELREMLKKFLSE